MRGPMRFPGPFPGDQRVSFPNEGQIHRGPHPGEPNLRHQGPRFVLQCVASQLCTNLEMAFHFFTFASYPVLGLHFHLGF